MGHPICQHRLLGYSIKFYFALQIVAARSAVILGGSELEVRVGPDRVGEGAGEEGEAQRRARSQEEGHGEYE